MKMKPFKVLKGGPRQPFIKCNFQETVCSLSFHIVACIFKI